MLGSSFSFSSKSIFGPCLLESFSVFFGFECLCLCLSLEGLGRFFFTGIAPGCAAGRLVMSNRLAAVIPSPGLFALLQLDEEPMSIKYILVPSKRQERVLTFRSGKGNTSYYN